MSENLVGEDPELVAKSVLHSLGDLISKCSPEQQPAPEVLGHFLALYREVRGTPTGLADTLKGILASQVKAENALGILAQRALEHPGWTRQH